MDYQRFSISVASLLLGLLVITISVAATYPRLSAENKLQFSHRQFYWRQPILPDHIFYPLLMVVDRVVLELTPTQQRTQLQLRKFAMESEHLLSYEATQVRCSDDKTTSENTIL